MKATIILIVVLAIVIRHPAASAAQTDPEDGYTNSQCAACHEEIADDHAASLHSDTQCLECHKEAVAEEHAALPAVNCRQCHAPHDEKVAHDAHNRVACRACHQKDGIAVLDPESGEVIFRAVLQPGRSLMPHQMVTRWVDSHCRSCHFKGNALGASSLLLPPKSILCMPCHVATFSIGDRTTVISLLIFAVGMGSLGAIWLSAGRRMRSGHRLQHGLSPFLVAFVADVLFIKRLYRLSPMRWFIHALFYYPILIRMVFGMMALTLSLAFPETDLSAAMLDKNHPFRALLFDLTGLMIIAGVAAALLRGNVDREAIDHLPPPGRAMTLLLGFIVLVGFFLEGLRIAMTGWPDGAQYAILGYGVSLLMKGMTGLSDIYGYVWHAHAIIVGVFAALIPFTRMIHMITAPVVLMVDAPSRFQPNH